MKLTAIIDQVRAIPIIEDNAHPSSSFMPFHSEWYDEDGYSYYDPAVTINNEQISEIASLFNISESEALSQIINHELGHAIAYYCHEDHNNESLAWEYAGLLGEVNSAIREYCLNTYGEYNYFP